MKNGKINLEIAGKVAILTLKDPDVLNALGTKMKEDLTEALDTIDASAARCVLMTGTGRAFCAGANLKDPDRKKRVKGVSTLPDWANPTMVRLRKFRIPIVSSINGLAAGIGMSLALMGDIKIMAKSAYFLQAFARIGLVPDGGSTWTLPRLIGIARAMELSMLAEKLPAETALEWGLVNRVVADADLAQASMEMAQRIADGPASLGYIRQMYWDSLENDFAGQLQAEADYQVKVSQGPDNLEGVAAFREKRKANFIGQ